MLPRKFEEQTNLASACSSADLLQTLCSNHNAGTMCCAQEASYSDMLQPCSPWTQAVTICGADDNVQHAMAAQVSKDTGDQQQG